jgi:hypothetical protein
LFVGTLQLIWVFFRKTLKNDEVLICSNEDAVGFLHNFGTQKSIAKKFLVLQCNISFFEQRLSFFSVLSSSLVFSGFERQKSFLSILRGETYVT